MSRLEDRNGNKLELAAEYSNAAVAKSSRIARRDFLKTVVLGSAAVGVRLKVEDSEIP
jgi:ribonuclease HIII